MRKWVSPLVEDPRTRDARGTWSLKLCFQAFLWDGGVSEGPLVRRERSGHRGTSQALGPHPPFSQSGSTFILNNLKLGW